ncbi:hypothetical protein DLE01_39100, partial [Streptomyces sp. FT05W]
NLYKHTDLQSNFGANMLALVDGVPRTLSIDAFIRHWVTHQIERPGGSSPPCGRAPRGIR